MNVEVNSKGGRIEAALQSSSGLLVPSHSHLARPHTLLSTSVFLSHSLSLSLSFSLSLTHTDINTHISRDSHDGTGAQWPPVTSGHSLQNEG